MSSGRMMVGMAAMCGLMCLAPVLLAAGAGSALLGFAGGAGGWMAGGLALVAVAGVLLWARRRRASGCQPPPGRDPRADE